MVKLLNWVLEDRSILVQILHKITPFLYFSHPEKFKMTDVHTNHYTSDKCRREVNAGHPDNLQFFDNLFLYKIIKFDIYDIVNLVV